MGADGGICWMAIKDPAKYERVRLLLKPFWQFTDMNGEADWQQGANNDWLDANPEIWQPKYLVGTYSSFKDFALFDLKEILSCSKEELCLDPSLTFQEFREDLLTRPFTSRNCGEIFYLSGFRRLDRYTYDLCANRPTELEILMADWAVYHPEDLEGLEQITISSWQDELNELLDSRVVSVETWT